MHLLFLALTVVASLVMPVADLSADAECGGFLQRSCPDERALREDAEKNHND
jgi:hypothetical protein